MKLARSRLAQLVAARLRRPGAKPAEVGREVAAYLLSEGRAGELDSLMRDVMQVRADDGMVEVTAVSAHPLTDTVRGDIRAQIKRRFPSAKDIIISEVQDASVVGGVRLELAQQQLDLSIRSKLNRFKQLTTAGGA